MNNVKRVNKKLVPKGTVAGVTIYQDSADEKLYYKDINGVPVLLNSENSGGGGTGGTVTFPITNALDNLVINSETIGPDASLLYMGTFPDFTGGQPTGHHSIVGIVHGLNDSRMVQLYNSDFDNALETSINMQSDEVTISSQLNGSGLAIEVNPGAILVSGLSVYADNAAAILGGLSSDCLYKTATGELRIVI